MALKYIEEKAGGFFKEFWKFAAKGNAVQLAVAVVLGTAFGAIVNSLVADIIMPLLSLATNNVDFSMWSYTLREGVVIGYGRLIQASINFLVVGLSIFVIFKMFSGVAKRLRRKEAEEPAVAVTTEEKLLSEIRDLLKEQANKSV
jgi:large conductance mechanosensitive channel